MANTGMLGIVLFRAIRRAIVLLLDFLKGKERQASSTIKGGSEWQK